MSIVRNFNLYLNAGNGSAPYINVNQYDQGEQWVFTLYKEDGTKYSPSTGAIVGIKADNRGIINTGTVDADGRVVINETQQMTAAAGIAIFELLIDGDSHGTANFLVNVEQRPGDNADLSDSDLSLIQQAVDSAEVIVEVIGDGDPSEVIGEHVDDWLDNHPEATTTVLDGAITAPKINQSLWDKLLVSEEASGAVASFEDGADDVPVSSLKVALEPIQTGTGDPSPNNVRPIIAANGKNVLNYNDLTQSAIDAGIAVNEDGTIYDSSPSADARPWSYASCNWQMALPAGTYTLTVEVLQPYTGSSAGCRGFESDGTSLFSYIGPNPLFNQGGIAIRTFTLAETTDIGIQVKNYSTIYRVQIEHGEVGHAWEPYQGIMVSVVGRNLFGGLITTTGTQNGVTYTANLDGTFTVNGTNNSGSVSDYIIGRTVINRNAMPVGNYVLNGGAYGTNGTGNTLYITIRDANNQIRYVGNNGTADTAFSLAEGEYISSSFIRFAANVTANNLVFKPMIRRADDTDSTFAPYVGTSYPYTLGQSVYGGTVDLATGVLTVTHGVADENSFTGLATGLSAGGLHWADYPTSDITINGYALSNMVDRKDGGTGWVSTTPCFAITDLSTLRVYCAESTLADFKSAYSGLQIIYPLATPQTIQLTPQEVKTLLGYNNISSTGTVDVIYHADTKLYVDKMTNVDNSVIAPTEADFVATRNYTVNDLVIVNDTLYKVTANIASGSAITPNSNVQQTTLSALIKALS